MDQNSKINIKSAKQSILNQIEQQLENKGYQKLQLIGEICKQQHYKGYSIKQKRNVILRVSLNDQQEQQNLQKEYELMKQLKEYKNIIQIFEYIFVDQYSVSIIIEEQPEINLFEEIQEMRKNGQWFSGEELTDIILQISHALCMIHYSKISHQDINSKNIIKSQNGTYKLAHFKNSILIQEAELFQSEGYIYEIKDQQKLFENKDEQKSKKFQLFQKDLCSAGQLFLEIMGFNFNQNTLEQIKSQIFRQQAQSIIDIQKQQLIKLIINKLLTQTSSEQFYSYDIINTILPYLPYSEASLLKFIPVIQEVEHYQTFENSKNPQFLLNTQLEYLKTLDFINNKIKNTPIKVKADTKSSIAYKFTEKGMYEQSNLYRQQCISFYNQIKPVNQYDIIYQLQQICFNYKQLQMYKESLKYGKKALKLAQKFFKDDNDQIARSQVELSWCYKRFGKEKKGLKLVQSAYQIYCKIYQNQISKNIGDCLCTIACMKSGLKKYEESIEYYKKSIEVYQKIYNYQEHPDIATCFENMGVTYENQGDFQMSLLYYQDSLKMKKFLFGDNSSVLSSIYKKLYRINKKLGREEEAQALKIEEEQSKTSSIIS